MAFFLDFQGVRYCFTGSCATGTREELSERVKRVGGLVTNAVTRLTDFVVLGAKGNATWAFTCYGRKVETAIALRKKHGKPLLVHENDFFDALQDAESGIV